MFKIYLILILIINQLSSKENNDRKRLDFFRNDPSVENRVSKYDLIRLTLR